MSRYTKNLQFNPPSTLSVLKSMDAKWVAPLINEGKIRLYINKHYRETEDETIRDAEEGVGVLNYRGNIGYTDGLMNTYIWCTSQNQIDLRKLVIKYERDAAICIEQPKEFARRLLDAAFCSGAQWYLECAPVKYDKRSFRDRNPDEENGESNDFHIFQKAPHFAHEQEYRFALTDLSSFSREKPFIELQMGPCHDIIKIMSEEGEK